MRAVWFIGKFELLLNCTKYQNYSPKSRTPQQPQNVSGKQLIFVYLRNLLTRVSQFFQLKRILMKKIFLAV